MLRELCSIKTSHAREGGVGMVKRSEHVRGRVGYACHYLQRQGASSYQTARQWTEGCGARNEGDNAKQLYENREKKPRG